MPFTPEQIESLQTVFNKPEVQHGFDTSDPQEIQTLITEAISYLQVLYDQFVGEEVKLVETALVWYIITSLKKKVARNEFRPDLTSRLAGIVADLEGLYLLMRF